MSWNPGDDVIEVIRGAVAQPGRAAPTARSARRCAA